MENHSPEHHQGFLRLLNQSEKISEIKLPLVHSCMKRKERKNRRGIYWYLKCLQTLEIERLASLPLKVSKSRKQFLECQILLKNERNTRKNSLESSQDIFFSVFCQFFRRIENSKNSFRDLRTFMICHFLQQTQGVFIWQLKS